MQINTINVYPVTLHFLNAFPHSLKKGAFAENIVVETIANGGNLRGYGEGAPRPYVTGESQETAVKSIRRFLERPLFPLELDYVEQIWDFVDHLPEVKEHNAALCALEMSLLDLLGKKEQQSVMDFFPKDYATDRVFYGAAFPLGNKRKIREAARFIQKLGIKKLKLKMGKDFKLNMDIIEAIVGVFGGDCELKIDINGVWNARLAFEHMELIDRYGIRILEQPMTPGSPDFPDFAGVLQERGIKLMADESACSMEDVQAIVEEGHFNMVNVRLSKCGGFRRSLRMIDYLRKRDVPFQIACQLGESGLLSAAGRVLSLLSRDALYHDGSYDEFLLKENVTSEDVTFGWGGEAGPLGGIGLGVEMSRANLARLSRSPMSVFSS